MLRASVACVIATLALTTQTAAAQPDPVAAMRQLAPLYWATPGPCSTYAVNFDPLENDRNGRVYGEVQMSEQGAGPFTTDCVIHLNSRIFTGSRATLRMWPFFCLVFLHEYAHLLGIPDSPDPSSFMFHVPQVSEVPGYCLRSPTGRRWHRRAVYRAFP